MIQPLEKRFVMESVLAARLGPLSNLATTAKSSVVDAVNELVAALLTKVAKGEIVINVKDYGAKGDGATNDTAAINAAIDALLSIQGAFGGVTIRLHFPAGRYLTDGGHVIPSTKRVKVIGDGPYVTILYRRAGATGDLLTINAQNSGVEDLTVDGGVLGAPGGGDGIVLNAPYCYVRQATVSNNGGDGIAIGKAAGAILHRLEHVNLRLNRGYGISVYTGANTDGQWSNVDVGTSGKAGVRLSAGMQMLTAVHSWGNGLESTSVSDKCGFLLNANGNMLNGCEAETNLGSGVVISGSLSHGQSIDGGSYWGNVNNGIYQFGGSRHHKISTHLFNNGVGNTAGTSGNSFASIFNESGSYWTVDGCNSWDDAAAIPAGSYPTGYVPTNPYPGRAAIYTLSRHYAETNSGTVPDFSSFTGNVWLATQTRTGLGILLVGTNHQQGANVESGDGQVIPLNGRLVSTYPTTRPTVAADATGAAPTIFSHNDTKGIVYFGSGSAPAAGKQVTVTFAKAYAAEPVVVLTARSKASVDLVPYVQATATGFSIGTSVAPAASQAGTAYQFNYHVIG